MTSTAAAVKKKKKKRVLVPIARGSCEYQTMTLVSILGQSGLFVQTASINNDTCDDSGRLVKMVLTTVSETTNDIQRHVS